MKTLIKKIYNLTDQIEMGFLTKSESLFKIRELRNEIADIYGDGSNEFMECLYPLMDANEIAEKL